MPYGVAVDCQNGKNLHVMFFIISTHFPHAVWQLLSVENHEGNFRVGLKVSKIKTEILNDFVPSKQTFPSTYQKFCWTHDYDKLHFDEVNVNISNFLTIVKYTLDGQ